MFSHQTPGNGGQLAKAEILVGGQLWSHRMVGGWCCFLKYILSPLTSHSGSGAGVSKGKAMRAADS